MARRCRALTLALLLQVLVTVAPTSALATEWLQFDNPYFHVYTDASEQRTRPLVEDLDRFRQAVLLIANWKIPANARQVEVFILDSGFREITGQTRVGGFAGPLDDLPGADGTTVLVMPARGRRGVDERLVLRHEYVHALIRYRGVRFPRWYEEGLAELFAHSRVDGSDVVVDVAADRIRRANWNAGFGIDTMASFDEVVDLGHGSQRGVAGFTDYYLQAWLLTHYLTFGNPELAPQLEKCILYSEAGMPPKEAFKLAFGMTASDMGQNDLRHYTNQLSGRRYKLARPIVAVPFTLTVASADAVEARLGAIRDRWKKPSDPDKPAG